MEKRKSAPRIVFDVGHWRRMTQQMSLAEKGIVFELLMSYLENNGTLTTRFCRRFLSRINPRQKDSLLAVFASFFDENPDAVDFTVDSNRDIHCGYLDVCLRDIHERSISALKSVRVRYERSTNELRTNFERSSNEERTKNERSSNEERTKNERSSNVGENGGENTVSGPSRARVLTIARESKDLKNNIDGITSKDLKDSFDVITTKDLKDSSEDILPLRKKRVSYETPTKRFPSLVETPLGVSDAAASSSVSCETDPREGEKEEKLPLGSPNTDTDGDTAVKAVLSAENPGPASPLVPQRAVSEASGRVVAYKALKAPTPHKGKPGDKVPSGSDRCREEPQALPETPFEPPLSRHPLAETEPFELTGETDQDEKARPAPSTYDELVAALPKSGIEDWFAKDEKAYDFGFDFPYGEIMEVWNTFAGSTGGWVPCCRDLNEGRKRLLRHRARDFFERFPELVRNRKTGALYTPEERRKGLLHAFHAAIWYLDHSPFLAHGEGRGEGHSSWRMEFDWIMADFNKKQVEMGMTTTRLISAMEGRWKIAWPEEPSEVPRLGGLENNFGRQRSGRDPDFYF